MIDKLASILPSILNKLEYSVFTFYPTGSRYFGGVSSESDWDFFVEDSKEVREFLCQMGFESNDAEAYDDSTVVAVWSYYTRSSWDKGLTKIDVQLISEKKFSSKLMVQKLIKDYFGDNGLPGNKQTQREIWKLMLKSLTTLGIV